MSEPLQLLQFRQSSTRTEIRVSKRSAWSDLIWYLDHVPPGTPPSHFRISWGFGLPDGSRLSSSQWSDLRDAAKTYVWSLKIDPPLGRRALRNGTICRIYQMTSVLIQWMNSQGYCTFSDLDRDACERFVTYIATRKGGQRTVSALSETTLWYYRRFLYSLYLQGEKYPELTIQEPFPGVIESYNTKGDNPIPYTPDVVAVPLVSAALRLIDRPADDVIALFEQAQQAFDKTLDKTPCQKGGAYKSALRAIAGFRFSTLPGELAPWHEAPVTSTKIISFLMDRIADACFIVIAYLTGARVSEILGLQIGCIQHRPSTDGTENFAYMVGRIYKTVVRAEGDEHRWVIPAPVERAITVMEHMTETLREKTGRSDLWLNTGNAGLIGPDTVIAVLTRQLVNLRLNTQFAVFINLPAYKGEPWHLSTHQARKTFARFIGKRDRTALHALQKHFGHISRAMTDLSYVGTDFKLDELIDGQAREETVDALQIILTSTNLGGRAGREIVRRSQFRGRTIDAEVTEFAARYVEQTGMVLGICPTGFCVFKKNTSACHGTDKGPNEVLRSPEVCGGCINHVVSEKHRPFWEEYRNENTELLKYPNIGPISRDLAQRRVAMADRNLRELDD